MTDSTTNTENNEDLRTLINNSKETEHEDNETVSREARTSLSSDNEQIHNEQKPEPVIETMPKAGQKYWLSSAAKKKKNEYMREYNAKRKAELMRLQRCQLHQREIKLLLCNGQVKSFQLEEDSDYINLIKNLLGTLTDNSILKDYEIIE